MILFLLFPLLLCTQGWATEVAAPEVIVDAQRAPTPLSQVTASVTVISRREIEKSGKRTVAEILGDVPGLTLVSQGGQGQLTQVFFRGLSSGQTLVLLDGIELNDPLNPERFFDFSNLSLAEIEKIEIVRGTQSVLQGSDAIGGVIHLTTRKSRSSSALTTQGSLMGGSYGTLQTRARMEGSQEALRYSLGAERLTSSGFSVAASGTEPDSREVVTLSTHVARVWGESSETSVLGRFSFSKNELDAFDGAQVSDDLSYITRERSLQLRAQNLTELSRAWKLTLAQNVGRTSRVSDHPPPSLGVPNRQFYQSDRLKTEATAEWQPSSLWSFLFLAESERESGDFSEGLSLQQGLWQTIHSLALEGRRHSERSATNLGLRGDWNSKQSVGALSARAAERFQVLEGLSLKGSVGTGFKSPTLYQLYVDLGGALGGNPFLRPERSASVDLGVEMESPTLAASFALMVFRTQVREQIEFLGSRYTNLGRTLTQGAEFSAQWVGSQSGVRFTSTSLFTAQNEITGSRLAQRPHFQMSLAPDWRPSSKLRFEMPLRFKGRRLNGAPSVSLPSYTLLDLGMSWEWSPALSLRARLENLLDRQYQESLGYGTAGRSGFFGVEARL